MKIVSQGKVVLLAIKKIMLLKFYKQVILTFLFSSPKAGSSPNLLGNSPYTVVDHQVQSPGSQQQFSPDKRKHTILKTIFLVQKFKWGKL